VQRPAAASQRPAAAGGDSSDDDDDDEDELTSPHSLVAAGQGGVQGGVCLLRREQIVRGRLLCVSSPYVLWFSCQGLGFSSVEWFFRADDGLHALAFCSC
jgi:hypothetical protein